MNTKKILFAAMMAAVVTAFTACEKKPDDLANKGKAIPYTALTENLNGFQNISVDGSDKWSWDSSYGYAKMTGYVSGTRNANETWLVSPKLDLTTQTKARLYFRSCAAYMSADPVPETEAAVFVSTDYDGKEANLKTGTWTRLEPNLTANKLNWAFITQQYDLTAYAGKSIYIAFKYISTITTAGTWEVKNVKVDTEAIDVIGDNDKGGVNNPYTVAEVIDLAPADKTNPLKEMVYVTGTIVGVWDNTGSESVAAFTAPFNTADNVLLGTQEGYICVQLAKTEPRKTVNLKDTPANVGKTLTVRGDVILYNTLSGVKEISKFELK
ncbi:MAG: DUF5017 domain-containing protein [Sphingobacteriia bacterium]|nr:DUF5017 domain-containing protein [Sphingobacteriia bacterium]